MTGHAGNDIPYLCRGLQIKSPMRNYLFLLSLFFFMTAFSREPAKIYDITSFGAKGDGHTLNTEAIQQAIDRAYRDGGGLVRVPAGHFLTGPVRLRSGIELHLEKNAVLLGSVDPYDYPYMKTVLDHTDPEAEALGGLLQAKDASHLSVSGEGVIDGQGRQLALRIDSLFYAGKLDSVYYNLRRKRPERRPGLVVFSQCRQVRITGITLKNSGFWVQTYRDCSDLTLDSLHVESDAYWNNDGIDIVDCHQVRVTHCVVNAADDGICLKSETAGHYNDRIYIADCTIRSSASAIKFGTASVGGFRHVRIQRIRVFDTYRSVIALESVDGGFLEDVVADGIDAVNTGNPLFIRLGHRDTAGAVGSLRHILIKNMRVQVPFGRPDLHYELRGPALDFFHNPFPSSIVGLPGHPVTDVVLENIRIVYPGGGNDGLAYLPLYRLSDVPENPADYPEFSMFGELPAWAFYIRHATGILLKGVAVEASRKDYRPAFVFDDVSGLILEKTTVHEEAAGKKQFILRSVSGDTLRVPPAQMSHIR